MIDWKLCRILFDVFGSDIIDKYVTQFSTRIIVQKMLYLMSQSIKNPKINLNYNWIFYLKGPYSSDIAHMLYHINEEKNTLEALKTEQIDLFQFSLEENKTLRSAQKFKEYIEQELQPKINQISIEELYETIATFLFLYIQKQEEIEVYTRFGYVKKDLSIKLDASNKRMIFQSLQQFEFI